MGCLLLCCRLRTLLAILVLSAVVAGPLVMTRVGPAGQPEAGTREERTCSFLEPKLASSSAFAEKPPFELVLSHTISAHVQQLTRNRSREAGVTVWQLDWQGSTTGHQPHSQHLCHCKDICVASRAAANETAQYYIAAPMDRDEADKEDIDAFKKCLRATKRWLGYKNLLNYRGNVSWVTGHTWGFAKIEKGNHPAAWHGAWSRMLSAVIGGADILARHGVTAQDYFSHFQLLEESMDTNGWAQFVMQTHSQAARAALMGGAHASLFNPSLPNSSSVEAWQRESSFPQQPRWADERRISSSSSSSSSRNTKPRALTCFKSMWLSMDRFYSSPDHAAYYRSFAFSSLGLPFIRRRGCSVSQLQAVILVRTRPLWNMEDMFGLMKERGLSVRYESVDENTPYQDQVDVFVNADILVSVHGSHLNNQLFMAPGSALIEVFQANYYHPEQKLVAKSVGVIRHYEMRDQPYPPVELIQKKNKRFMRVFNSTQELRKIYSTAEECMIEKNNCRGPHRNLGAYADMAQFKTILTEVIPALTNTPGCLQAE